MQNKFTEQAFEEKLEAAQNDENILGFFFGGSRGKGFEDESSDWDLRYVVRDGSKQNYCKDVENSNFEPSEYVDMEYQVFTHSEFKEHALGGNKTWDRYSFAHVKTFVDKTGDIQDLIDAKWRLSGEEEKKLVSKHMDSYVHALYRSVKAEIRENTIGAGIHASMSIFHLSQALFASQGRVSPHHDYIPKELLRYPLTGFSVSAEELVLLIADVVKGSSVKSQQDLAKVIQTYMLENNLYTYERWQDKYDWFMGLPA